MTCDAPLAAWLRFASWQIQSRIKRDVVFSWIGGQRLAVRRGMTGATGNIYVGLHEFADMTFLLHVLREGDLFLDVGANVGSYTVLAAGIRHASVWAFEPDPQAVQALTRNLELNDLTRRVTVFEHALGDLDGEVNFTRDLDTTNHVVTGDGRDLRVVPVRRLDGLLGDNRPLMMKMDVEGFEEAVVRGAVNVLSRDSLKVIAIETVTAHIEAAFDRHGFKRAHYDPFGRRLGILPGVNQASNVLFVRDWDFVASRLASAPAIEVLGKRI